MRATLFAVSFVLVWASFLTAERGPYDVNLAAGCRTIKRKLSCCGSPGGGAAVCIPPVNDAGVCPLVVPKSALSQSLFKITGVSLDNVLFSPYCCTPLLPKSNLTDAADLGAVSALNCLTPFIPCNQRQGRNNLTIACKKYQRELTCCLNSTPRGAPDCVPPSSNDTCPKLFGTFCCTSLNTNCVGP